MGHGMLAQPGSASYSWSVPPCGPWSIWEFSHLAQLRKPEASQEVGRVGIKMTILLEVAEMNI